MADGDFRLPASSYEEIVKIILGYGYHGKEASITDISHKCAVHKTNISANSAFLTSIGIIEQVPGGRKIVTSLGNTIFYALQNAYEEEINNTWSKIVKNNEFLQKIVAAIRIRQGMDKSTLITHIIYTAGQKKSQRVVTGANAIIEIFKHAKLVTEKDDRIIPINDVVSPEVNKQTDRPVNVPEISANDVISVIKPAVIQSVNQSPDNGNISVNLRFNITCSVKEFIELAPDIKRVLQEFSDESSVDEELIE